MTETHIKQGKPLSPFAQRMMHAASVAGAIATVIFCIWAYQKGLFTSQEALSEYMQRAGHFGGPPVFYLITNFTNSYSYYSGCFNKYCRCIYFMECLLEMYITISVLSSVLLSLSI